MERKSDINPFISAYASVLCYSSILLFTRHSFVLLSGNSGEHRCNINTYSTNIMYYSYIVVTECLVNGACCQQVQGSNPVRITGGVRKNIKP